MNLSYGFTWVHVRTNTHTRTRMNTLFAVECHMISIVAKTDMCCALILVDFYAPL